MNWLRLTNVYFGYKNENIFQNLNLEIGSDNGNIVAIMGTSGSGKSTLLKLMLNILKPKGGSVNYFKEDLVLGYLPQNPIVFEHLNTLQNARYFQTTSVYKNRFDESLFIQLKNTLGLNEILDNPKKVSEISGGQKQRICLLRELSIRPDILFLDEATKGIDNAIKLSFLVALKKISKNIKINIVYVTHDKFEAELIADDIIYLESLTNGIVKSHRGKLDDFINKPPCIEALEVFTYPISNILKNENNSLGLIITNNFQVPKGFYISVKQENILLGENGTKYNILYSNAVYTRIQIENSKEEINLLNSKFQFEKNLKFNLSGELDIYSEEGEFFKTIKINE